MFVHGVACRFLILAGDAVEYSLVFAIDAEQELGPSAGEVIAGVQSCPGNHGCPEILVKILENRVVRRLGDEEVKTEIRLDGRVSLTQAGFHVFQRLAHRTELRFVAA